ncbi:hypothetical protein [Phormidium sp. CCY1219]|uniref:hypothetical protein n=1 Tax=Phormidium sp. CCY1219 TaxID=2886104 RepID=UPI002D1E55CA|nr:hypothetical protein [Phormidium sp. CCY1219]MEB3829399.1 hypothetical protein [Phormidium sp. CCY1219]
MMVALVIPLFLANPVKSENYRNSPRKCGNADDPSSALNLSDLQRQSSPSCQPAFALELGKKRLSPGWNAGTKQVKDACSISGRIYGIERQRSRSIYVVVIDPNTENALAKFQAFSNDPTQPNYAFSLMRPGRYLLSVFHERAGTLVPFRTRPSERLVNCSRASDITDVDFELQ